MRAILLASVAVTAFMSDTLETVTIQTENGPVRVNKSDYDADQNSDKPTMKLATDAQQEKTPDVVPAGAVTAPAIPVPPAPSAPGFNPAYPEGQAPNANIATPTTATTDQLGVVKTGKKFYVVTVHDGKRFEGERINKDGYDTSELAWDAVKQMIAPVGIMPVA